MQAPQDSGTERGFTLIEVMVVIAIVGLMAAIAIPNFLHFQAKAKQGEAQTLLKAIFSAQKASFPTLHGYTTSIADIGFNPEWGNRYVYDLGPFDPEIAMLSQGACANLADRHTGAPAPATNECGVEADAVKYGATFSIASLQMATGWNTGPSMYIPVNTNASLVPGMDPGINGAVCPACDFTVRAYSNIDNDASADVQWVSSQIIEVAPVGRCLAMSQANGDAYVPGLPAKVVDDTCVD